MKPGYPYPRKAGEFPLNYPKTAIFSDILLPFLSGGAHMTQKDLFCGRKS
jgi:hypothetical protein